MQRLYDGVDLIAEYDAAGNLTARHVHGPGSDEPVVGYTGTGTANKTWLYADHLGSIVAAAGGAGALTGRYSYGPFGEPGGDSGARFRYTGQEHLLELGLYHYKARAYSPTLGRFLQTDPMGYADDLNLYTYAGNNPVSYTDPLGLYVESAADVAFIAFDVGMLVYDGFTTGGANWATNTGALVADVAGLLIPFATGGGVAYRAGNNLVDVARQADSAVPAGGSAATRGTHVHTEFDTRVNSGAAGNNVVGETAYVRGQPADRYRPKGSSNPDAVVGDRSSPNAVFDLKTGKGGISPQQMSRYRQNVPGGTPVYTVTPNGHNAPRPTTYTGVGAGSNLIYQGMK